MLAEIAVSLTVHEKVLALEDGHVASAYVCRATEHVVDSTTQGVCSEIGLSSL